MSTKPVTSQTCNTHDCDDNLPSCSDLFTESVEDSVKSHYSPRTNPKFEFDFSNGMKVNCKGQMYQGYPLKHDSFSSTGYSFSSYRTEEYGLIPDNFFGKAESDAYILLDYDIEYSPNFSYQQTVSDSQHQIPTGWVLISDSVIRGKKICHKKCYRTLSNITGNGRIHISSCGIDSSRINLDSLLAEKIGYEPDESYYPVDTEDYFKDLIANNSYANVHSSGTPAIKLVLEWVSKPDAEANHSQIQTYNFFNSVYVARAEVVKKMICRNRDNEDLYKTYCNENIKDGKYEVKTSIIHYTDIKDLRFYVNPRIEMMYKNKNYFFTDYGSAGTLLKKMIISGTGTSMDGTYTG
ncbi:MAG: hypothetical protein K2M17_02330 [Bacilli bacterium]|nr:hypothetical protein [Bacilli bacterium]